MGVEKITRSTNLMDQTLQHPKLTQNAGKSEHIPMFYGPGQDKNTKHFKQEMEQDALGRVDKFARYLGAWPTYNGSTAEVVRKRIQATKESFYGMGRAWRANIGLYIKSFQEPCGEHYPLRYGG